MLFSLKSGKKASHAVWCSVYITKVYNHLNTNVVHIVCLFESIMPTKHPARAAQVITAGVLRRREYPPNTTVDYSHHDAHLHHHDDHDEMM